MKENESKKLLDTINHTNIRMMAVPEGEERKRKAIWRNNGKK